MGEVEPDAWESSRALVGDDFHGRGREAPYHSKPMYPPRITCGVRNTIQRLKADRNRNSHPTGQNKEGIDAILMMNEVSTSQIQRTPQYADAMTRSLLRVGADKRLAEVLFASSLPFVVEHLQRARERGEILESTDVDVIAMHLIGQQWGTVLLWMMNMLPLKQLSRESKRAQFMILTNVASSACVARLKRMLEDLNHR